MDILTYKLKQYEAAENLPKVRIRCISCLQPDFSCFCSLIKAFDPQIKFVILIHPIEIARRIATGRMAHLCLKNSHLIAGHDFTKNQNVNALLKNENLHCIMLYPGPQSDNLSLMNTEEKLKLCPPDKTLTIFVIDGTWATAKKMVSMSQNLKDLPKICFTPHKPSNFRVRKQPRPECYSTIEAIHETIDLLSPAKSKAHDNMLFVFDKMVTRQIELAQREKKRKMRHLPF